MHDAHWYDVNKVWIKAAVIDFGNRETSPANAKYFRFAAPSYLWPNLWLFKGDFGPQDAITHSEPYPNYYKSTSTTPTPTQTTVVFDDMARANTQSGLGTTPSGQAWNYDNGAQWGIFEGRAYLVNGSPIGPAWVNTGLSNFAASVQIYLGAVTVNMTLTVHYLNATNRISAFVDPANGNTVRLSKRDNDVVTLLGTGPAVSPNSNFTIGVNSRANNVLEVLLNGQVVITYQLSAAEAAKYKPYQGAGIRMANYQDDATFKNFTIKTLPA